MPWSRERSLPFESSARDESRAKTSQQRTVELLASADAGVVEHAIEVVDRLMPLQRCSDPDALQNDVEGPTREQTDAVSEVRSLVAKASAQTAAAKFEDAKATIAEARQRLEGISYAPVETEVAVLYGELLERAGEPEAARQTLTEALGAAARSRQWRLQQRAAAWLILVVGERLNRFDEVAAYRELALSTADPIVQITSHAHLGALALARGDFKEAEQYNREAVALSQRQGDQALRELADACNNLGAVLADAGRYSEAETELKRALVSYESLLGPMHPDVWMVRANLGLLASRMGNHAEAETLFRAVIDADEALFGRAHAKTAADIGNLAPEDSKHGRRGYKGHAEHR